MTLEAAIEAVNASGADSRSQCLARDMMRGGDFRFTRRIWANERGNVCAETLFGVTEYLFYCNMHGQTRVEFAP